MVKTWFLLNWATCSNIAEIEKADIQNAYK